MTAAPTSRWSCEDCEWPWPLDGSPPDGAECDSCGGALTATCAIDGPHCSLCGSTDPEDVEWDREGYSGCCNKRITIAHFCDYPENHEV